MWLPSKRSSKFRLCIASLEKQSLPKQRAEPRCVLPHGDWEFAGLVYTQRIPPGSHFKIRLVSKTTVANTTSQIRSTAFVVAFLSSGLVATAPPRLVQDEIRRWAFPPYQAGEQPAHLRYRHGNQFFIGTEVTPFSPCSNA